MTDTVTTVEIRTDAPPSVWTIDAAATGLLQTITMAGLDHPGWKTAGPLVSAAAELWEAIGAPVTGFSADSPPVVCERDVAMAARRLPADGVRVENEAAAAGFVALAAEATVALS